MATILSVAGIVHGICAVTLVVAGGEGLLSDIVSPQGLPVFAPDSSANWKAVADLRVAFMEDGLSAWLTADVVLHRDVVIGSLLEGLHIRAYSLCHLLLAPLLGNSILSVEPLNLALFLAMTTLTFKLAEKLFDPGVAWLCAGGAGLLPSLILHTTQLLKSLFVIVPLLLVLLVCVDVLKRAVCPPRGWALGLLGATAVLLLRSIRPELQPFLVGILLLAMTLLVGDGIRRARSIGGIVVIGIMLAAAAPLPQPTVPLRHASEFGQMGVMRTSIEPASSTTISMLDDQPGNLLDRLVAQLDRSRWRFTANPAGTTLDPEVEFQSVGDVVRYLPRAFLIGFFAPFPESWVAEGALVGHIGRALVGLETFTMYVVILLASRVAIRDRQEVAVVYLAIVVIVGVTGLALAVPNWGALYRFRYPFWILLMVLAAGSFSSVAHRRRRSESTES